MNTPNQLKPTFIFFMSVLGIGLLAGLCWAPTWSAAMIVTEWILACFAVGNLVGFLFGIPKDNQAPPAAPATGATPATLATPANSTTTSYAPVVNRNLIEISDWLTKIIVGLGLVKLTKIPPYLSGMAAAFANGINAKAPAPATTFGYGIIIGFLVIGFLFGYLVTRLYLSEIIGDSDKKLLGIFQTLATVTARTDSLAANQNVLAQAAVSTTQALPDKTAALDGLAKMSLNYGKIEPAGYGPRVQAKKNFAAEITDFVVSNQLTKPDILGLCAKSVNDGLVLVLAAIINLHPEAGDDASLLKYGPGVISKYVQYRVLIAVGTLMDSKLLDATLKSKFYALLDIYQKNADDSLSDKIKTTLALLKNY